MKADASLLIDIGSTGCRAVAVDDGGRRLGQALMPIQPYEDGSRVEYEADGLMSAVEWVVAEAAGNRRIRHAGLAVQRGSVLCWDRDYRQALGPVISWRDRRTAADTPAAVSAEQIRTRTGLRFSPYAGAPKLAWCLEHLPAVRRARCEDRLACGPLGSFVAASLTASAAPRVDDTLAQRTLLWSRETFGWADDLLDAFGVPGEVLPEVTDGGDGFGRLTGLDGNPALAAMIGDQNAVPFVDGAPDPGTLYINLGTGAFLLRPVSAPIDAPEFQLSFLGRDAGFAVEGSVHGAASALAWLERRHGRTLSRRELSQRVAAAPSVPLFVNTVGGLGSPWWRPGPEPAFIDDADTAPDTFDVELAAVIDSIAFLIRANFDAMNRRLGPPERIVVAGGLSRADALMSRLAGVLGMELMRLRSAEGTAMGLWCKLEGRALWDSDFEQVPPGDHVDIERRYRRWLACMPDCPG